MVSKRECARQPAIAHSLLNLNGSCKSRDFAPGRVLEEGVHLPNYDGSDWHPVPGDIHTALVKTGRLAVRFDPTACLKGVLFKTTRLAAEATGTLSIAPGDFSIVCDGQVIGG